MKTLFAGILLFFGLFTSLEFKSNEKENSLHEDRIITVTGSADVTIQPDEIELEIVIKEHGDLFSNSLKKVEERFYRILEKNKITKDQITFNNANYDWYHWWRYRNHNYKQKVFKITLDTKTDFLSLVKDLDFKGISSLRISNTTNSKLQELRKEVKIQAVKAAKEKASYLLESIDEKLGRLIALEEMPQVPNYYWQQQQNILSNVSVSSTPSNNEIENVKQITLRYEVKAKFEIGR